MKKSSTSSLKNVASRNDGVSENPYLLQSSSRCDADLRIARVIEDAVVEATAHDSRSSSKMKRPPYCLTRLDVYVGLIEFRKFTEHIALQSVCTRYSSEKRITQVFIRSSSLTRMVWAMTHSITCRLVGLGIHFTCTCSHSFEVQAFNLDCTRCHAYPLTYCISPCSRSTCGCGALKLLAEHGSVRRCKTSADVPRLALRSSWES